MKDYPSNRIKNIVLAGSAKSGKTTLAECMMFEGGVIDRMGSVDAGNCISDFHDLERTRGHSVFTSIMHTEWRGTKINLLDTPGYDEFSGELICSLRVGDTALLCLNAHHGVEVGTEISWRYLKQYGKPTIFVVNQTDHAKSDFNFTIEQAQQQFGKGVVVMQYPYNEGDGFDSIIDLLKMVMYKFPPEGGKPEKLPIPDEERERADELHNILVEAAAEHDDTLMELYFEKGELDEDEMRKGLRLGMLQRSVFPVFCLSAKRNMGSGRLMGFIGNVAPTAEDMGPEHSKEGKEIKVSDKDTTLFVFKSSHEKHTGSMSYFKVCSGEVTASTDLINSYSNEKVKLSQLYVIDGKNRHAVSKLSAGDIGATVKLKDTHTNHTLRSTDDGLEVNPIQFPESRIHMAVEPVLQQDEEKLAMALHKLHAGDPTFIPEYSKELRQTIIHGQGELHLQINKLILEQVHGVEVNYLAPRISYRETIQNSAKGYYKHKKQSGGAGQYAEVYMEIAPYHKDHVHPENYKVRDVIEDALPWGGKLVFCNCIVGGVIDTRFLPAIHKGIMEVMENGPLTMSYVRDIVVYIYDGKMHSVDSNEISFKLAGQQAFRKAFMDANPKLLEPVYRLEVLTPESCTGDVMTDLQTRRALVEQLEAEGTYQRIIARVPLAELNKYATSLSAISQGRATHSRSFLEYALVPRDIQSKMLPSQMVEAA